MNRLRVLAEAAWPESPADVTAPPLAGFVVSSFSAVAAEAAHRCMRRRPAPDESDPPVTAVIIVSALGDVVGAAHVADAVDGGRRVGPLLFFQSVPHAVAGHVATRWQLTGPVVSVGGLAAGLDAAALLIEDGDADEALLIRVEQAYVTDADATAGADNHDRADAVLLSAAPIAAGKEGP